MARPLSAGLQKTFGVPVIVQYRPGAGGQIALRQVARADHDGYTLVLVLAAYAIGPLLSRPVDYDPVNGFEPVCLIAKQPLVLYTRTSSAITSVSDLVARAKSHPDTVTVASSGNGNTTHLAVELLSQAASIRLVHVPYHGGSQAVAAAMSGNVDAVFAGPDSLKYVVSGKLRALAVASDARLASVPDTPTFADAGLRDMLIEGWYGLLAPRGTSPARIQKLNGAVEHVMSDVSFNQTVFDLGFKLVHMGPPGFKAFIERERARWGKLIADRRLATDQMAQGVGSYNARP